MTREIEGLLWSRACPRPAGIPIGRPRGAKAAGLRYERALARALPAPRVHGQWFEFEDARGRGVCQTDLLLSVSRGGTIVVLEVKYSWTAEGHQQLEKLYLPIVQKATGRQVIGIVVTRRLTESMPRDLVVCSTLAQAIAAASAGRRAVWHWLGTVEMARAA